MPKLTIIRGLPGSGKSTEAKKHDGINVEADMYHYDDNDNYVWKAENMSKAHSWCQQRCKELLDTGYDVVVSNTFTTLKELRPYIEWGYEYTIIDCSGNYVSIHNVPEEVMDKMRERWISSNDIRFVQYLEQWRK